MGWAGRHKGGGLPGAVFAWCVLAGSLRAMAGESTAPSGPASLDPRLGAFIQAKQQQARELAKSLEIQVLPDYWKAFELFRGGNWQQATNCFHQLNRARPGWSPSARPQKGVLGALLRRLEDASEAPYRTTVLSPLWQPLAEVEMACEQFVDGEPKYARAFGDDMIASIPKGSIYFGGTDPGRGWVTALVKSHLAGDPFFVLTQNLLVDENYVAYLRAMYGKSLYIPSQDDLQRCFIEYMQGAQGRMEKGQLKPGEDVKIIKDADGKRRVQVSGQVAVMAINGLLAKLIFDKNPERECYVEESFPLDWMYPHLAPHGLILKIERAPLEELSAEVVRQDHDYWKDYCARLLGEWLGHDTPVRTICETAEKLYLRQDLSGFKGDPKFAQSGYAQKAYSKLRSAIGGVYAWRWENSKSEAEKKRLLPAAELAFRQAFALCPYSPEAAYRYVNLLLKVKRADEALLVAESFRRFEPDNSYAKDLLKQVQDAQQQ